MAGRVETTALVVQALRRMETTGATNAPTTDPLVRIGLLFLLRAKDRYGVWYSTQATINVLDTLMTLLASDQPEKGRRAIRLKSSLTVSLLPHLNLPAIKTTSVIRADISRFLQKVRNEIHLRRSGGLVVCFRSTSRKLLRALAVWRNCKTLGQTTGNQVRCDWKQRLIKTPRSINEEISCRVKAERVGFRGYGMMLAEIGLPPGADVDRASLESAVKNSGWAINHYDVLPDRVIVYLWPRAGGVNFNFKFRPRFALTAKTSPSVVYDYYNPEARAVIAPTTFVVK